MGVRGREREYLDSEQYNIYSSDLFICIPAAINETMYVGTYVMLYTEVAHIHNIFIL